MVLRTGKCYLSPEVTDVVINNYVEGPPGPESLVYSALTNRNARCLQLVVEGKTSNQIAKCLGVSVKTVETHRNQLMHKLKIKNLPDLVKYAIQEGLTSLTTQEISAIP